MNNMELEEITKRLDEIICLLKVISKPESMARKVVNGLATGAGILGLLSAVDIIRTWLGG
jgi:hypothetical protein